MSDYKEMYRLCCEVIAAAQELTDAGYGKIPIVTDVHALHIREIMNRYQENRKAKENAESGTQ